MALVKINTNCFRAGDEYGGALNSIKTSNPTLLAYDFLRFFENIKFCNGGIDNGSPLAAAISVALVSMQNEIAATNKGRYHFSQIAQIQMTISPPTHHLRTLVFGTMKDIGDM